MCVCACVRARVLSCFMTALHASVCNVGLQVRNMSYCHVLPAQSKLLSLPPQAGRHARNHTGQPPVWGAS